MALVTSTPLIAEVAMDGGSETAAATVRATVVQASTVFYDTNATLEKAERLIGEAAAYGSQLVVFPEAFVGGYPRGSSFGVTIGSRSAKGREEFRKYHASAIDVPGPEVDRLAAMAEKYKVYLVMGVIEREGYTLYCTVLFFDSNGQYLGKHRKLMPTGLERVIWGFGDGSTIPVFETPVGKIGALICWENRMPLLRTALYGKGIEIYCAPTADAREIWQASMTHIALEGGCFVLSANQFCRRKDYPPPPEYVFEGMEEDPLPDSVVCAGGSVIISPSGVVLAGPNYEGEALISADLDLGEIVRAKFDFDVVGHYARPEVLSLTVKDHPQNPVSFASTIKSENPQKQSIIYKKLELVASMGKGVREQVESSPAKRRHSDRLRLSKIAQNLFWNGGGISNDEVVKEAEVAQTLQELNTSARRSDANVVVAPTPSSIPCNSTFRPNLSTPTDSSFEECVRLETRKKRGRTMMKTLSLTPAEKPVVDFNELGQPVGPNSKQLSSYLGTLAREMVPVNISGWKKVDDRLKDDLWMCIQAESPHQSQHGSTQHQSHHGSTSFPNSGINGKKCKLLNWQKKVVAEGTIASIDPTALVHHVPLGTDTWKVWVDVPVEPKASVWRETSEVCNIQQAVGTTVAWHKDFIALD